MSRPSLKAGERRRDRPVVADVADALMADGEIALPFGVIWVAGRELLAMSRPSLKAGERRRDRPGGADVADQSWLMERSRCHSALLGSRAASCLRCRGRRGRLESAVEIARSAQMSPTLSWLRRDRAAIRRYWGRGPRAACDVRLLR